MKMTGSDREENIFRTEFKRIIKACSSHPDLLGIPEEAAVGCTHLSKNGVDQVTDGIYKFLLQELNDNNSK